MQLGLCILNNPAILWLKAVAVVCVMPAWGQLADLPDPTPEIRRQEQRQEQLRRAQELRPDVRLGVAPASASPRLPQEQPCRPIDSVVFEAPHRLQAALHGALAGTDGTDSPLGQCLGAQGIALLMERARNALIAQGYLSSRIEAPAQDLNAGRLHLQVVFGRIARIDKGAAELVLRDLRPLAEGEALNLRDVEQSLENLRRNPSARADFSLQPGTEPDTTDIVLSYGRTRPLRMNLSVNDSGNAATGKLMSQATLSWDNPSGRSDLAYLSVGQDIGHRQSGPRGNENHALHYSLPWGYWLWSLTASQSDYRQTIVGAFQSYLYSGNTRFLEAQVGRVIHRNAQSKTRVEFKGFSRRSRNFIDDTEVQVQRRQVAGWGAALQHTRYLGAAAGDFELAFRRGTGAMNAMPAPEQRFGEGTARMQLTTAHAQLQWPVPGLPRLSVSNSLRLQANHTPLVPQDRLCLGGRYSVRGFDGLQSLCGDRGYLARNDLVLSMAPGRSVYVGADLGRVGGRSAQHLPERSMAGAVLGFRGQQRLLSGQSLALDAFLGRPVSTPTLLKTATTTAGFSLSLAF